MCGLVSLWSDAPALCEGSVADDASGRCVVSSSGSFLIVAWTPSEVPGRPGTGAGCGRARLPALLGFVKCEPFPCVLRREAATRSCRFGLSSSISIPRSRVGIVLAMSFLPASTWLLWPSASLMLAVIARQAASPGGCIAGVALSAMTEPLCVYHPIDARPSAQWLFLRPFSACVFSRRNE